MTRKEAIDVLKKNYPDSCFELLREAVDTAFEALAKMEAIQEVIDMPTLWEQDDRCRYAKIIDIVRKENKNEK